jgi:hypothetical protein
VEEEDVKKTDDESDLLFDRLSSDEGTAKERGQDIIQPPL